MKVTLIRHGVTVWNQERRIQGQTDTDLSPEGRAALERRTVPDEYRQRRWIASPLRRAVDTAMILSGFGEGDIARDARLMEMNWGDWEGERLDDLRARYSHLMSENELRGLYFRPVNGECPHELRARALAFLDDRAAQNEDIVVVTHKGVIRALFSQAFGWNMRSKPPVKPDWTRAHEFEYRTGGALKPISLNVSLDAET